MCRCPYRTSVVCASTLHTKQATEISAFHATAWVVIFLVSADITEISVRLPPSSDTLIKNQLATHALPRTIENCANGSNKEWMTDVILRRRLHNRFRWRRENEGEAASHETGHGNGVTIRSAVTAAPTPAHSPGIAFPLQFVVSAFFLCTFFVFTRLRHSTKMRRRWWRLVENEVVAQ